MIDECFLATGDPIARVLHGQGATPPLARMLSDDQAATVVTRD